MAVSLFSLVSEQRIHDILQNLQEFTGLAIRLIDADGVLLQSFGQSASYCSILKKNVFDRSKCFDMHVKAGRQAQVLGEAYIFSCHAGLNHIAFPLIHQKELLGSVILGPFLLSPPDSGMVAMLPEHSHLTVPLALELFEALGDMVVMEPTKVNQLKKLLDNLLSPVLPGERVVLLENQRKMAQQARINETIQVMKEEEPDQSILGFYKKEKALLEKVKSGTMTEVKALLNELMGYVLFSEGGEIESVRVHTIELATLLSRVAIDCGARVDSIYRLNSQFIFRLYQEDAIEDICMMMQEVAESFMNAMFVKEDQGNPYIRKALQFMRNNYSEKLELARVAEYVGLSANYFSTLFHHTVGMRFRDYLCKIRVEESKVLLLSKQYSLSDIAVAMGFPDQSYYCKAFKRLVGVTPGKYRA